uniref:Saposin B-type domain-containing protein n=1 Tax=Panagrellus redivivus TaxID=6233 RepID=A0A7E4V2Y7_PANRE
MKVLVLLALVACAAVVSAKPKPKGFGDDLLCNICEDVCVDTESWVGTTEQNAEAAEIAQCEKLLNDQTFGKLICEDVVKNYLDQIIAHMTDPATDKSDCQKACQEISMCKN